MNFFLNDIIKKSEYLRLRNNSFCIIANDCWGGEVYHYFNKPYNTPFIGLYLMAPCYVKLLQNFEKYMQYELQFIYESKYQEIELNKKRNNKKYPTGVMGDIEIQFLHYKNEAQAYEKWNRRKERISWDNLFLKFDASKDMATDDLAEKFDSLPFSNKLCLSNKDNDNVSSNVYCPDWEMDGAKMFNKSIQYFSLINWLNGGGVIRPNLLDRIMQL